MTFPLMPWSPPARPAFDFRFHGSAVDNVNRSTYTFSGLSFGSASSDRVVIVAFGSNDINANSVNSVTIGGVAATLIRQDVDLHLVGMYYAAVPTGATGDVVISLGGTAYSCAVHVASVVGSSGAPHDSAVSSSINASSRTVNVDVTAGGASYGVALRGGDTQAITWTGLSDDTAAASLDTVGDVSNGAIINWASEDPEASTAVNKTFTASYSASGRVALIVSSWAP